MLNWLKRVTYYMNCSVTLESTFFSVRKTRSYGEETSCQAWGGTEGVTFWSQKRTKKFSQWSRWSRWDAKKVSGSRREGKIREMLMPFVFLLKLIVLLLAYMLLFILLIITKVVVMINFIYNESGSRYKNQKCRDLTIFTKKFNSTEHENVNKQQLVTKLGTLNH